MKHKNNSRKYVALYFKLILNNMYFEGTFYFVYFDL